MKIRCRCGTEDHILLPFDDPHTEWIECTQKCKVARQLKAELAVGQKLSSSMTVINLGLPKIGMFGH